MSDYLHALVVFCIEDSRFITQFWDSMNYFWMKIKSNFTSVYLIASSALHSGFPQGFPIAKITGCAFSFAISVRISGVNASSFLDKPRILSFFVVIYSDN